jgi:hypothetical protein
MSLPPRDMVHPRGYCARCQHIVEIQKARWVKMKNGKTARRGYCPTCGGMVWSVSKV